MRRLASFAILLAVLAPVGAHAAGRRAVVLLVPQDKGAYSSAVRFTEFLEGAVDRNSAYQLKDQRAVMGDPTPAEAIDSRKAAAKAIAEGKKLAKDGNLDDAEAQFRTALKQAETAVAAIDKCGEYCDAVAYLAAVQVLKGDTDNARENIRLLLAADKNYKFDGAAFGQNFQILLRDVRKDESIKGQLGTASIYSSPPGARIYVDGQLKGFSPVQIERVPVGKHLLRVERAGAITYGQLLEITPTEDAIAKVKLVGTPEYSALETTLERVANEVERGGVGAEVVKLGSKLKVDRAVLGTVRTNGDQRVTVNVVLVDFGTNKRLASKSRTFEGDEFGQLEQEVRKFGNLLLADAEKKGDTKNKSADPLDHRSGMEDWDEETGRDEPSVPRARPETSDDDMGGTAAKKGDPLEQGQGQTDW